jgi:hypothetical protein
MSAVRSVPNFQSGAGVRPRDRRLMTGNHAVVSASTKECPPFRLRIQRSSDREIVFSLSGRIKLEDFAQLQRLHSLAAADQDSVRLARRNATSRNRRAHLTRRLNSASPAQRRRDD